LVSALGGGGGQNSSGARLSQHPVDRLIRDLIDTGRQATAEEIAQILDRMATAPFEPREAPVPAALQGTSYLGRPLGNRASALLVHLVQRVLVEEQWSYGTTEHDYLSDLRQAVQGPPARLVIYRRRGGHIAGVFLANVVPPGRRGPKTLLWLYVVYSADRGIIVSGYQVSSLQEVRMPGDARWLT
jgi:hypothetical protein